MTENKKERDLAELGEESNIGNEEREQGKDFNAERREWEIERDEEKGGKRDKKSMSKSNTERERKRGREIE